MKPARCLSTLAPIAHEGYSPAAQRRLAGGRRRFPLRLEFNRTDVVAMRQELADRMSISGVQDKLSLRLERGRLMPTDRDGEYILKPLPGVPLPRFAAEVPANEHLTMQLAGQVFGIATAVNALIRFADGELAFITRRFDRRGGRKVAQEDFCQLAGRTPETHGKSFKYDATYEEVGRTLRRYSAAYRVEVDKLFVRIVFCYAFSNGDAHLKNFSLFQSEDGDYILTPAYDLVCTSLHLPGERRLALDLFDDGEAPGLATHGFETGADFVELARRLGIPQDRARGVVARFNAERRRVRDLITPSFLGAEAKANYLARFEDRVQALGIGVK